MTHGVFHPEIQLFKITPSVHICVEHRKYPRECFTTAPCHQISGKYSTLVDYIAAWEPVLDLEAATVAVNENDELTIHNLDVRWEINSSGNQVGFFSLQSVYYKSRHINIYEGDFVCVRVPEKIYMAKSIFVASEGNKSEVSTSSFIFSNKVISRSLHIYFYGILSFVRDSLNLLISSFSFNYQRLCRGVTFCGK